MSSPSSSEKEILCQRFPPVFTTCPSALKRLPRAGGGSMVSAEASAYLSAVKWGDEGYYLKEFSQKFKLPQVAKIIKGQYQSLGVPTLPSPTLNQIVFVASAGMRLKVVAQCVKFKDAGRRMVPVGPKLTVPENYEGWFEILSEDGRSVRCIESVAELAKKRPRSFLIREPIKVYLSRPDDVSSVWDKSRTLSTGDVLEIGDLVSFSGFRSGSGRAGKFLRCVTSLRETIYMPLDLRGKFSNIAGEDNISGVHTVRNLLSKRFPLMVRLVHGKPPVGVKTGSQFVPEMRLFSLVEEESFIAMPLLKNVEAVPLPPNAPLKVLAPRNADLLSKLQEHEVLAKKCRCLMSEVTDCIQICDTSSTREIKHVTSSPQYVYTRRQAPTTYRTIPLVKRSASDPQGTNISCRLYLERGHSIPGKSSAISDFSDISESDNHRYEEIDQIYDYVRGFAPLPANLKNEFSLHDDNARANQSLPQISPMSDSTNKTEKKPPEPPPIDTIPARKLSNSSVRPTHLPPHKITVSIVNRNSRTKDGHTSSQNHRLKKSADEHVYEKIDRRKSGLRTVRGLDGVFHAPARSNSASKVFLQSNIHANNANNNKVISKGHLHRQQSSQACHQSHQTSKYRFQKHMKGSPQKDASNNNNNKHISKFGQSPSGMRNVTTSPLFHIRYKSLTDLLMDNKSSPDSSNNSSGKKMDGSASTFSSMSSNGEGTQDDLIVEEDLAKGLQGKRRLSRPKSLSNLINNVAPRRRVDNHNYYNLVQNDLIRIPDFSNPKFYSMPDSTKYAKNHYGISAHNKKLGTLYL